MRIGLKVSTNSAPVATIDTQKASRGGALNNPPVVFSHGVTGCWLVQLHGFYGIWWISIIKDIVTGYITNQNYLAVSGHCKRIYNSSETPGKFIPASVQGVYQNVTWVTDLNSLSQSICKERHMLGYTVFVHHSSWKVRVVTISRVQLSRWHWILSQEVVLSQQIIPSKYEWLMNDTSEPSSRYIHHQ
jgi:hypothetical protein